MNKELSPGFCLIDNFSDCFFFHTVDHKDVETRTAHCNKLKNIFKDLSKKKDIILVIFDVSVKNNITTLVSHIRREQKIIMKTIHHTINIMFTKVELFAMRYGISQVFQTQGIVYIIIVTDTILAIKRIFDTFLHLYQL